MLTLERHPRTVALARRFLSEALAAGHLEALRADVELLGSELVTNVLLHTDSEVTVRVMVGPDRARVEVEDACSVPPVGGLLEPTAICGRGLVLVERLSHGWGVTPVPPEGKKVWFELGLGVGSTAPSQMSTEELLDFWDAGPDDADGGIPDRGAALGDDSGAEQGAGEPTRRVRVEGVATELLNATKSHLDELVRDLSLATGAAETGGRRDDDLRELGSRLRRLAVDLISFSNQIRRQALDAAQSQAPTLTLELDLPLSLRPRLIDYRDALDLADELCAAGRLLLAPAPVEHVQFRRWKLSRIIDQLADASPQGWLDLGQ